MVWWRLVVWCSGTGGRVSASWRETVLPAQLYTPAAITESPVPHCGMQTSYPPSGQTQDNPSCLCLSELCVPHLQSARDAPGPGWFNLSHGSSIHSWFNACSFHHPVLLLSCCLAARLRCWLTPTSLNVNVVGRIRKRRKGSRLQQHHHASYFTSNVSSTLDSCRGERK